MKNALKKVLHATTVRTKRDDFFVFMEEALKWDLRKTLHDPPMVYSLFRMELKRGKRKGRRRGMWKNVNEKQK
jgi:hypothetical protein